MGILDDLVRDIEDLLDDAESTIENNPIPLAGPPKTGFEVDVNSASSKSETALANEFFSGVSGTVLSPPTTGLLDWWHEMASNAKAVVDAGGPTPIQVQQAADELATMSDPDRKSELIAEYT